MDINKLKRAAELINGECPNTRCEECEFRVKIPCKPIRCGLDEGELLKEAVRIIEDQQERIDITAADMHEWISVDERLPEEYENVLVCAEGKVTVGQMWLFGDGTKLFTIIGVTHWMPLPKPPKDGEQG